MKYEEEIVRLVRLYMVGEITEKERIRLEQWRAESAENRLFFEEIAKEQSLSKEFVIYRQIDEKEAFRKFERKMKGRTILRPWMWRAAAIVVVAVGIAALGHMKEVNERALSIAKNQENIHPGSSKATLILSTGERVPLQENSKSRVILEEGTFATDSNHRLMYHVLEKKKKEEIIYNRMEIPRGGEYKLVLSDGTAVYLNSATKIKYPVEFRGAERRVWLTGEAFFEVKKDSLHPFLVETENTEIKVLGTSFNVNTFGDAGTQTVLVEGCVNIRVPETNETVTIQPGQLAVADKSAGIEVKKVDVGLYTDWKNGIFRFESQRLEDIMNTLSNWYDVDVFYQSQRVKELHFSGFMERYDQIGVILDAINEATGVVFAIRGKTITISE